jgi:hypothetical protein
MASLEVFHAPWGAVGQTLFGLTLSDRRRPLIAAKSGPIVARRASSVRFLINRFPTLQTGGYRRAPKHHQGRANRDPLLFVELGIAGSQGTGPNPASR